MNDGDRETYRFLSTHSIAILADYTADDVFAQRHYQAFKRRVIAKLPTDVSFLVNGDEVATFVFTAKEPGIPNPEGDVP